jgi:hypothetical protein
LFGTSDGANIIDAVIAARRLEPRLSNRWFAAGHSGGGQTVLRAADLSAQNYAPDLAFQGTVPIEPASSFLFWFTSFGAGTIPGHAEFVAQLLGLKEVHPELLLSNYLGADALNANLLNAIYTECDYDNIVNPLFATIPGSEFTTGSGAAQDQLQSWVQQIAVPQQPSAQPLFWPLSSTTSQLPVPLVTYGQQTACQFNDQSYVKVYPGIDHTSIVAGSAADVVQWMNDRLAGIPAPSSCQ